MPAGLLHIDESRKKRKILDDDTDVTLVCFFYLNDDGGGNLYDFRPPTFFLIPPGRRKWKRWPNGFLLIPPCHSLISIIILILIESLGRRWSIFRLLILMDDFWRGKINREKIRLVPPSSFIFSRFYFYYFYYYWTKWLDFVFISGRPTWSLSLTRCDGRCNRTWCILRADNLLLDILFRRAETKIKNSRTKERERENGRRKLPPGMESAGGAISAL
jgi:hypothetical protein